MSSTTAVAVSPLIAIFLAALSHAGSAGFFDEEEELLFAHPARTAQEQALDGEHIVIDWEAFGSAPDADLAFVAATAWQPDGGDDFHQIGTVFSTYVRLPSTTAAARCAKAIAEHFTQPRPTAG